jgi:gliding motility-associated-like protein
MRIFTWLMAGLFAGTIAAAQNPATVFVNPYPNKTVTIPCGSSCTNLSIQVPNIKETTDYLVSRPTYLPFAFTTPGGATDPAITIDDRYSYHISFPFAFSWCFFGTNYPKFVVGTNGIVTFDTANSGLSNAYPLETGGNPIPIPYSGGTIGSHGTPYYPKASIMGPYHDIDPAQPATDKKIEWRVEGTAPRRRFVISYNNIPLFQCNTLTATHQMVLYENTGVIEIYIKDKPVCAGWNQGLAILGLQDESRTKAVPVPGKNATAWGATDMDSAYRFTPSGGVSRFKRAQLLVNNVVVATNTTDTSTVTATRELLNVNFNNVCPTADSTAYVIRVTYGSCNNPNIEVSFTDTVFVKKSTFTATFVKTDATCDVNGSITVTATGGATPYEYSANNGTTYQAGNTFTNLAPGIYTVIARQATAPTSCPVTIPVTIALNGSVNVNAGLDTTICSGATFTRTIVSNATSFVWTSSGGLNAPTVSPSFQLAPTVLTDYVVTAIRGNCTAQDNLRVTVNPQPTVNVGSNTSITLGQSYTIPATVTPAGTYTYAWTPSTGLSSASVLQPVATPQVTTPYTLEVTSQQGCKAVASLEITVIPYCVKVMEAFTPNGDGINDFWLITQGSCLKVAKAQVYNRNGARVFESNDYRNNWNGTYNGKPLPDGTYYYILTYTLFNGQTEYKRGNLTILR